MAGQQGSIKYLNAMHLLGGGDEFIGIFDGEIHQGS